jgi:hypothetical protein
MTFQNLIILMKFDVFKLILSRSLRKMKKKIGFELVILERQ